MPRSQLKLIGALSLSLLFACGTVQGATITFTAQLTGAAEFPPVDTEGSGFATVIYDDVARTLRVIASFSGLTEGTTVAHIHAPTLDPFDITQTAGVATPTPTFPGFPAGVTSGAYDHTLDLSLGSSYNAPFLAAHPGGPAAAEAALVNYLLQGRAYLNIHTTFRPGGEIRGFLQRVPENSATAPLLMLGVLALAGFAARRQQKFSA